MTLFTESVVEEAVLNWFRQLGYVVLAGADLAPESGTCLREDYGHVVLFSSLRGALRHLNPALPAEALEEAFRKLTHVSAPALAQANHDLHRMIVDGVTVEYQGEGRIVGAPASEASRAFSGGD